MIQCTALLPTLSWCPGTHIGVTSFWRFRTALTQRWKHEEPSKQPDCLKDINYLTNKLPRQVRSYETELSGMNLRLDRSDWKTKGPKTKLKSPITPTPIFSGFISEPEHRSYSLNRTPFPPFLGNQKRIQLQMIDWRIQYSFLHAICHTNGHHCYLQEISYNPHMPSQINWPEVDNPSQQSKGTQRP